MAKFDNGGRPVYQLTKVTIGDKENWLERDELDRVTIPKEMFEVGQTIRISVSGTVTASSNGVVTLRIIDPNSIDNRYRRSRKRLRSNS